MNKKHMPDFKSHQERDDYFRDHADYFTVIKKDGVGRCDRTELKNLEYAEKVAEMKRHIAGGRYMIYAVINEQSALVKTVG